jgi:bacillithiol biosynthesis cysteine-adding enzyme BshC
MTPEWNEEATQAGESAIWSWLREPGRMEDGDLRWHPSQLADCIAARGAQLPPPLMAAELAELEAAHVAWGADAVTLANLHRLGKGTARVIVTGQQPGLLAGPLMVIYKTLGAVLLARELQSAHPELQFVPVFWLASEDHDFAEVRHASWTGAGGSLEKTMLLSEEWAWGQMVGLIRTASFYERVREHLTQTLGRSDFSDEVLGALEAAYAGPAATLESGFARLLLRLLRGLGVVIVTPRMGWLRRRAVPLLRREFAAGSETSPHVNARGAELAQRWGTAPPLTRAAGALNAFWLDPQGRRHTLRRGAVGEIMRALPHGGEGDEKESAPLPPWTQSELEDALAADPEQFSTNVVTRPMLQDSALPTVAQVVGPGEAAYLAQVESVYGEFGVFAPVRWPRPQAVLLEARVVRQMEKYSVPLEEALMLDQMELTKRSLRRSLAETDELRVLEELEQRQIAELEAVRQRLTDGDSTAQKKPDPAIDGAFTKLQQMMGKGYATLRERLMYQHQQDEGHLQRAMTTISHSLRPTDQPQERVLNPLVPYAWQYGLDWVAALAERLDPSAARRLQLIDLTTLPSAQPQSGEKP